MAEKAVQQISTFGEIQVFKTCQTGLNLMCCFVNAMVVMAFVVFGADLAEEVASDAAVELNWSASMSFANLSWFWSQSKSFIQSLTL